MAKTWAISGVDLHLELDGTRIRAGLESALREAVSSGRLAPGARLPATRALAGDLGIARNTVAEAYGQLVAEGWLSAMSGSGTRVAERPPAAPAAPARERPAATPVGHDLRPGSPDLTAFPRAAWLSAARRALGDAGFDALGYSDPRGQPALRAALADYLARARGVRTHPEQLLICSGFTQGIGLICRALAARGARTLAVEHYQSLELVATIVRDAGLRVTTVPVDEQGAVIAQLGDADAVLLTPAHQAPLGVALAPERRAAAVRWAAARGAVIIEDDYDGEFRYDRHPVGALQALAPERVIYAGTASKTLAPGVRLAWLAAPPELVEPIAAAKRLADRTTGAIDQLTLAELIASGGYDRHIRRSRLAYRRRRDRLIAALGGAAPQVRVSGIAAGLHAVLELPAGILERDVIDLAAARGLALEGLGLSAQGQSDGRQALVIGYATPPEHAFAAALQELVTVLQEVLG